MLKIHPLKNFKYKYLFGDIILATNVASFNNYSSIDIPTIDIGEFECMIVDPTMEMKTLKLQKKKNEHMYKFNKHFQNNWGMKLLWVEFVLSFDGRVVQV
jgi:hypothetical protein